VNDQGDVALPLRRRILLPGLRVVALLAALAGVAHYSLFDPNSGDYATRSHAISDLPGLPARRSTFCSPKTMP
jgi:hypothetical protein